MRFVAWLNTPINKLVKGDKKMVNYTLGDLIHDSFRVTHGMIAVFPETGHEVTLTWISLSRSSMAIIRQITQRRLDLSAKTGTM